MAEYIDRDKALKEFDAWVESTGALPKGTSYYAECRGCIECVPAADVEPVRHGRWEYVTNVSKTRGWFACSKCGSSPPYKASGIRDTKATYCPNCGAKMDGEA